MASAICHACKRRVHIYMPAAGDGSAYVYSSHRDKEGRLCYGAKGIVDLHDEPVAGRREAPDAKR